MEKTTKLGHVLTTVLTVILAMMLSLGLSSCDDDKKKPGVTSSSDVTTTIDDTTKADETTSSDVTTTVDKTTSSDVTTTVDETTSTDQTTSADETTTVEETTGPDEPEPHVHTEVTDKAVSATCTTDGKTEGKHCSTCGEILVAQKVVKAKGHTVVTDKAVASTCTKAGLTEGKHCSVCDIVIVEQTSLPLVNHTYDNAKDEKCNVCGFVRDVSCKHSKTTTLKAVAPTCTANGLTEGKKCSDCGEILVAQNTVKAKGHTEVTDKAVAATCTTDGKTEGKHCSVCNTVTVAQTVVKAKGHTEVTDKAVAATCTTDGKTEGKHCSVCNTVTVAQTVVKAKGHTEVTDKAVAATCTTDGKTEGKHCSVCNTVTVAQTVVKAKGHTEVTDKAVAATCTTDGKTEGKHCSVCNTVIVAQTTVKSKGHTDGEWIVDKEATKTEEGKHHQICSVCGITLKEETIPAIGSLMYEVNEDGTTCTIAGIGTYSSTDVVIDEYIDGYRVTGVGFNAFGYNCSHLTSITIPSSVVSIGDYAFDSCINLSSITVSSGNQYYYSEGNCLIEKSTGILIRGCKNSSIPNGVTGIGDYAFYGFSGLTNISIPNGVTTIGNSSFRGCSNLSKVTIPVSVLKIEGRAFYGTALTEVNYSGTDKEWESIEIQSGNDELTDVKPSKVPMFYDYVYKCFNKWGLGEFASPDELNGFDIFRLGGVSPYKVIEEEYYDSEWEEWVTKEVAIYAVSDFDKYTLALFGQTYDYSDIVSQVEEGHYDVYYSEDFYYDAENKEIRVDHYGSGVGGYEDKYDFEYDNYVEVEEGKFEIYYHYVLQIWGEGDYELLDRIDTDITAKIVVELVDGNYLMRSHTVTHP